VRMKSLGRHLLAEFYDCNPKTLDDLNMIEEYMKQAADIAGATIVDWTFHRFNPQGVSGVVVIAESHLAIHTWPEYGYAAIDLFTCGESVDPWKAFNFLKEKFQSYRVDVKELPRGKHEEIGIPEGSSHKVLIA